ncbi:MAG: serine/threonine-protein kinase [Gemmatimonadaceae bacterium]|nr:serine/threonine-protein kinase [Gemmatimonadaceae bacterium]
MSESLARLQEALANRYRVDRELGAGGMATVYVAHDLKHDRDVAIKVLHPDLGAALGGERFLGEIRTTARLQHPHILPLLDSGDANGLLYYVMPFVTGETLRARLEREKQLPIDDAVLIAREVADALGYAHGLGIIHRDIKPENILLQNGHALVADFGIALAVQSAGGARLTQTGISLGTPCYMSPEQAMGERAIDARSDIFALGAVTYEMLVGGPPFVGSTAQAIVAKVLTERPTALRQARDTVPPHVEYAVLKALAKLPADRYTSAEAFAAALVTVSGSLGIPDLPVHGLRSKRTAVAVGVLAVGASMFFIGRAVGGTRGSVEQFGQATQVTWESGLEIVPAISPDGKLVAYALGNGTRFKIFVRPVAGGRATPLTDDTLAVETQPQWSHDGARILYLKDGLVFSAPAGGGAPKQEVPRRGADVESATWSPDEQRIAYVVDDSVFVRDADGASTLVATMVQPTMCAWGPADLVACSAGNRMYLKAGMNFSNSAPSWIVVIDANTRRVRAITDSVFYNQAPTWSADRRRVMYVSNRMGIPDIFSQAVNADGTAAGSPQRLTVGLNVSSFTISADGARMAYAVLTTTSNAWSQPLFPSSGATRERPVQLTFGQGVVETASPSSDLQWLYFDSDVTGNPDLYRMRLPSGQAERLTVDRRPEFNPSPSPDGRFVAFHSFRDGSREIFVMPLDGGPLEQVTRTPYQELNAVWSRDGQSLSFASQSQPFGLFVARRATDGRWSTRKVLETGVFQNWSPDGTMLSFATELSGLGGLRVVSVNGGLPRPLYDETAPGAPKAEMSAWSDDGRTIYFKSHDRRGASSIWSVPSTGGTPTKVTDLGDDLQADRFSFKLARGRLYYTHYDRQSNIWVMDVTR